MPEAKDPLRGTGRTTAMILHAIAYALENPNKRVPFTDHSTDTPVRRKLLMHQIRGVIKSLGLKMSLVNHMIDGITLKSTPHVLSFIAESPLRESKRERTRSVQTYDPCSFESGCYYAIPGRAGIYPEC